MSRSLRTIASLLALLGAALQSACAALAPQTAPSTLSVSYAAHNPAALVPPPLDRSLFARDPSGALSEESLQKILEAPVEITLPARVGVLPIVSAVDWRGPGPSYARAPAGSGTFTRALGGTEPFTLVTEMMPIPSGALGMEALREIAARYRLRYLLLYREEIVRRSRANGLAAIYATVLGAFFVPGQTLGASGYVEASLFDVKTGTLLYTVRRGVAETRWSNVWHQEDKLEEMQAHLAVGVAVELARDVRIATARYDQTARLELRRRQLTASAGNASAVVPAVDGDR